MCYIESRAKLGLKEQGSVNNPNTHICTLVYTSTRQDIPAWIRHPLLTELCVCVCVYVCVCVCACVRVRVCVRVRRHARDWF